MSFLMQNIFIVPAMQYDCRAISIQFLLVWLTLGNLYSSLCMLQSPSPETKKNNEKGELKPERVKLTKK